MDKKELEKRTKEFAVKAIEFVSALPNTRVNYVLAPQFLKSATSIGANYREANRAESADDFIHKIAIVEKEAGECQFWLEIFDATSIGDNKTRKWLYQECSELLAIFTATGKTSRYKRKQ